MNKKYLLSVFMVVLAAFFAGCATAPEKPVVQEEVVWPLPPQEAKYKLLHTYYGKRDLESSDMLRLLGEEENVFFQRPHGIVADSKGNIYVSDTQNLKVFVLDFEKKKFRTIGDTGIRKVVIPLGLAIDNRQGLLFITDGSHKQVLVYDKDSGSLKFIIGQEPGTFLRPVSVAVNSESKRVYVADTKLQAVKAFSYDGKFLFSVGKGDRSAEDDGFNVPAQVALDRAGNLYVADMFNRFIKKFSPDGKFIKKFGYGTGLSSGNFSKLVGVAVDSEDHVYGLDTEFCNFQVFDQENKLLLNVGEPGNGAARFFMPTNIYIDDNDRIYISDTMNKRVKVLQYLGGKGRSAQ